MNAMRSGLAGDHDPFVTAHRAIPLAIARAARATGLPVGPRRLHATALAHEPRGERNI